MAQQVQTAQFLPATTRERADRRAHLLRPVGGRAPSGTRWTTAPSATRSTRGAPEMFRTIRTVDPQTATEQSAYDRWMDQTADREQARIDRVHGAEGIIPAPLWLVLFVICRR